MPIRARSLGAALAGGVLLVRAALARAQGSVREIAEVQGAATTALEPVPAPPIGATTSAFVAPLVDAYHALLDHTLHDTLADRTLALLAPMLDAGILAAGIVVALALAVAIGVRIARERRRTGDVTLHLDFPEAVDGEFTIHLSRRSARRGRVPSGKRDRRPRRAGVRRETQFDRLAPGSWFVQIEGELRAPRSRAVLANVQEEIEVVVEAQKTAAIVHAIPHVEAPVEFRIHWDRQPARDVGLCLDGRLESLRYAAQGKLTTTLALGAHSLVVGAGDRVVERSVRIESYEPKVVHMDLASPDGLVFKGCPPAVHAFLLGDLGGAARALDRDGQVAVGSLLRARLHQEQGQSERAAEQLERAGRWPEAAALRRALGQQARAGALFERAGQLGDAASCYAEGEIWSEAARAYAAISAWSDAARCAERAGDRRAQIGALEAAGEFFRAAAVASEMDDRARAIRLLQQIGPKEPEFGRAGELLALAFEAEGHLDLAARQLERRLELLAPGESAPELELHLAELLEESHDYARALEVLQALREREPTYPNVASRIEAIRKQLSGPQRVIASHDARPAPPGATAFVSAERYEILEELGRGGMGRVYKARDRRLGRIVALKRMPEGLRENPTALQLFLGEAQAAARMNHPNIVTLFDADQDPQSFFITMEYLEGLPLSAILKERGRLSIRDTLQIGLQVCAGLQYAHEQGIVHRDIKTANLFLTRDRKLKIMDFGLAKIIEAVRRGGTTIIAGTPDYMAPEQLSGRVTDGRTDLYALGITLFELSTGRLPFTEGDVADQHRNAPRPDPSAGIPDYPPALAQLVVQMMDPEPAARPESAGRVAEVLASTAIANGH